MSEQLNLTKILMSVDVILQATKLSMTLKVMLAGLAFVIFNKQ